MGWPANRCGDRLPLDLTEWQFRSSEREPSKVELADQPGAPARCNLLQRMGGAPCPTGPWDCSSWPPRPRLSAWGNPAAAPPPRPAYLSHPRRRLARVRGVVRVHREWRL